MSRLIYWRMIPTEDNARAYSKCKVTNGARAYSLRFKTKREAMEYWDGCPSDFYLDGARRSHDPLNTRRYTAPQREEIEYEGGVFGLLTETMPETFTG